jgi:ATP-dependent Lon protease
VLPVSGIRDKVLAAQRAGVKEIIFPEANKIDIEGLDSDVREGVELFVAGDIFSILDKVLTQDTGTRGAGSSNSD